MAVRRGGLTDMIDERPLKKTLSLGYKKCLILKIIFLNHNTKVQ